MQQLLGSNLWCIQTGTTLKSAMELMKEKRIRHLPIVSEDKKVVSILSQRDFTDIKDFQDLPADLFASFPVHYVTNSTPLRNIALLMIEKKISSVLLTDQNQNVLGIITTDDLLFQFSEMLKGPETNDAKNWLPMNSIITAGEFFNRLSDVGI